MVEQLVASLSLKIMQDVWETKGMWFWHCLSSVNAMYLLLEAHLVSSISAEEDKALSRFWSDNAGEVVERKAAEKRAYDDELRRLFDEARKEETKGRPRGRERKRERGDDRGNEGGDDKVRQMLPFCFGDLVIPKCLGF